MSNHWHYQLMKSKDSLYGEDVYSIHEYFELDDGPAWTEEPVGVTGNSIKDVKKALMLMLHDIDKHGVKDYE